MLTGSSFMNSMILRLHLVLFALFAFLDSRMFKARCLATCSDYKKRRPTLRDGVYLIDPDGRGGQKPFPVFCDMRDKNGVGVTVIGHDGTKRTVVNGCEKKGCFRTYLNYNDANMAQMAALTRASAHCEQFIKYECYSALLLHNGNSWLESRDGCRMDYWGGAFPGSKKCACGMKRTCALKSRFCNCDKNDYRWREDSGLLTYKPDLPVSELFFGDTGGTKERGRFTLGELKCYGNNACTSYPCLNGGTCLDGINDHYVCTCAKGFTGKQCATDLNKCSSWKHKCDKHASCIDTKDSYMCKCKPGYDGDGVKCTVVPGNAVVRNEYGHECSLENDQCGRHSRCSYVHGSYKCKCKPGYKRNGATCTGRRRNVLASEESQHDSSGLSGPTRAIITWALAMACSVTLLD